MSVFKLSSDGGHTETVKVSCSKCGRERVIASGLNGAAMGKAAILSTLRKQFWKIVPRLLCPGCSGWEVEKTDTNTYCLRGEAKRLYAKLRGRDFGNHSCVITTTAELVKAQFWKEYKKL